MNKKLLSELSKMEDWEFNMLEHHIHIARMVRNTMSKNAVSEKLMAETLRVQPKRMREVVNGSYPFDLRLLSRLDAFNQDLAANNAKMKVEAESIGFANYKEQYPLYVDRIQRLLDILEKQTDKQ